MHYLCTSSVISTFVKLNKRILSLASALLLISTLSAQPMSIIMDMVHHNPGEPLYESRFNRPDELKAMGYNAKCFFLFDAPTLAINWDRFDPSIMPAGSPQREWSERKAARLHTLYNECRANGLAVYAMSDLILLPKSLVEKYKIQKTFGDATDTLTQRILRYQIEETFREFPQMAGLVVRIGETYLQDAPYHVGNIQHKGDADRCIIPLINLLRDEICVKLNKKLIFRTWMSFDTDSAKYEYICNQVAPHPNLIFSVKHCEGDFHRGSTFSRILAQGRHPQIVEVQCAREYEGKGAYPNYIARGVIDGFEEHEALKNRHQIYNLRQVLQSGKLAGIWTWSRGGGWEGPYIKNELWCELNAWVMAQWAKHPDCAESKIFARFCKERLHLNKSNAQILRRIALLSESAVLRGIRSKTHPDEVMSMWTRDSYITFPDLPSDTAHTGDILRERDEAVDTWAKIVQQADAFHSPDTLLNEFVRVSCRYGYQQFRIFRAVTYLSAIKHLHIHSDALNHYLSEYNQSWQSLEDLYRNYPKTCSTLYSRSPHSTYLSHRR
jgi:hypothetical protein